MTRGLSWNDARHFSASNTFYNEKKKKKLAWFLALPYTHGRKIYVKNDHNCYYVNYVFPKKCVGEYEKKNYISIIMYFLNHFANDLFMWRYVTMTMINSLLLILCERVVSVEKIRNASMDAKCVENITKQTLSAKKNSWSSIAIFEVVIAIFGWSKKKIMKKSIDWLWMKRILQSILKFWAFFGDV